MIPHPSFRLNTQLCILQTYFLGCEQTAYTHQGSVVSNVIQPVVGNVIWYRLAAMLKAMTPQPGGHDYEGRQDEERKSHRQQIEVLWKEVVYVG